MANDPVVAVTNVDVFSAASDEEVTPTQRRQRCRQIAVLWSCGLNFVQIAEQLGCSDQTVRNYFKLQECQDDLRTIQNSDLDFVRTNLRPLLPEMCKRLKEDIEDESSPDKYRAMKFLCQIFGFSAEAKPQVAGVGNYEMAIQALLSGTGKPESDPSKFMSLGLDEGAKPAALPAAAPAEAESPKKAKPKGKPKKTKARRAKAIKDSSDDLDDIDLV